jgi:pimeloyl-ACP methyl ester carboxylesterase
MSTWVLLRGWAREARHWGDFPALLQAAVPADAVLALDLPGAGELRSQPSPPAIARIVERCRDALEERAARPPYSLLGLSLGGMVAMEWAARHAREVERCVLLATSARPFCAFYSRLRWRALLPVLRILLTRDARARERAILALVSGNEQRRASALGAWTRYAEEAPIGLGNLLRQLVAAARYRAPRRRPGVPVLLLAGGGDRLVDPRCSENLARAWQAPLRTRAGAGHDVALDAGAWVADEVAGWLRRG